MGTSALFNVVEDDALVLVGSQEDGAIARELADVALVIAAVDGAVQMSWRVVHPRNVALLTRGQAVVAAVPCAVR